MNRSIAMVAVTTLTVLMASCAPVGSEAWCKKMVDKPKGDWTANEASEYAKNCIFKSDEN